MMQEVALNSNKAKVGLVLSGGGAMAAYQAGVVKGLAEMDVQIHAVAGASAGALNGVIISETNGDLKKAAQELEQTWTGFVENSPIEWQPDKFVLRAVLPRILEAATVAKTPQLGMVAAFLAKALEGAEGLSGELASADSLDKMLEAGMQRLLLGEGLPLYVSIFESEGILTDMIAVGGNLLEMWNTPPSEFRHIQSLPVEEQKATILASAALPFIFQARKLGVDGRRYLDGGMGGYRTKQGNTPAEPLIKSERCTHLIVTHPSNGSPWRRDQFSEATVIEIRPGQTMQRTEGFMGKTRDMFNFSEDIRFWIEQGYEDTMRCVGKVKRSLDLVNTAEWARDRRRRAIQALEDDDW